MQTKRADIDAILHVARRMREADFREFTPLAPTDNRDELARLLADRYSRPYVTVATADDGEPIAVGGFLETRRGVLSTLFFATDRHDEIAGALHRFVKRDLLRPKIESGRIHRVEAVSLVDHHSAHRWLQLLGMQQEGRPMRGYGKNREAYLQFAWVRDDCPTAA